MANELQEYVDKTNENILSLEVVKKAEQIEKLAKSVKEKMKANYSDNEGHSWSSFLLSADS